jgi:hypothetical protein
MSDKKNELKKVSNWIVAGIIFLIIMFPVLFIIFFMGKIFNDGYTGFGYILYIIALISSVYFYNISFGFKEKIRLLVNIVTFLIVTFELGIIMGSFIITEIKSWSDLWIIFLIMVSHYMIFVVIDIVQFRKGKSSWDRNKKFALSFSMGLISVLYVVPFIMNVELINGLIIFSIVPFSLNIFYIAVIDYKNS